MSNDWKQFTNIIRVVNVLKREYMLTSVCVCVFVSKSAFYEASRVIGEFRKSYRVQDVRGELSIDMI